MNQAIKSSSISSLGLAISLVGYLIISVILNLAPLKARFTPDTLNLTGLLLAWLLAAVLIVVVLRLEQRPLASIGFKSIATKEVFLAIVIGIVLSLSVPLLTLAVSQILPPTEEGSIASVTENVPVMLLFFSVLTAGITEEIIYRGYLMERILEKTQNKWLATVISATAFALPHVLGWNLTHLIAVVLPLGFVLALLYVWKRNLIFNIMVHIVIDLPLVIIALTST